MKDQDIVKGNIGNALHDVSTNHVVATAYEIYDTNKEKRQEDINKDTDEEIDSLKDDVAIIDTKVKDVQNKTKDISTTYDEDSVELIEVKSDDDSEAYARVGTVKGKKGIFTDAIYDLEGEDELSLQEKVNNKVDREQMDEILQPLENDVEALKDKTSEISKTAIEDEDSFIEVKSDDDTTAFVGVGTKNGKSGIFAAPIYDIEGEDEKSLQEKIDDVQTEVDKKADAETVRDLEQKTSEIQKTLAQDEVDGVEFTNDEQSETYVKIGANSEKKGVFTQGLYDLEGNDLLDNKADKAEVDLLKNKTGSISNNAAQDEREEIVLATDSGMEVTSVSVGNTTDENEVVEFADNVNSEVYAKIGSVGDKKGIFTANLYDLEGNPYNAFEIDTINNILTIAGKKYKLIEYVEQ